MLEAADVARGMAADDPENGLRFGAANERPNPFHEERYAILVRHPVQGAHEHHLVCMVGSAVGSEVINIHGSIDRLNVPPAVFAGESLPILITDGDDGVEAAAAAAL